MIERQPETCLSLLEGDLAGQRNIMGKDAGPWHPAESLPEPEALQSAQFTCHHFSCTMHERC